MRWSGSGGPPTANIWSCPMPPTTASTGPSVDGAAAFVAVTQRGDDADNGIEADNNEFNNDVLPRSHPQIYNITLCGDPDGTKAAKARGREPAAGDRITIRNFLVTGFKTVGFQISHHGDYRPGEQRRVSDGRGCRGTCRPDARERDHVHHQRPLSELRIGVDRGFDGGVFEPRRPELPALLDRVACRWTARADPAADDGFFEAVTSSVPCRPRRQRTGWPAGRRSAELVTFLARVLAGVPAPVSAPHPRQVSSGTGNWGVGDRAEWPFRCSDPLIRVRPVFSASRQHAPFISGARDGCPRRTSAS